MRSRVYGPSGPGLKLGGDPAGAGAVTSGPRDPHTLDVTGCYRCFADWLEVGRALRRRVRRLGQRLRRPGMRVSCSPASIASPTVRRLPAALFATRLERLTGFLARDLFVQETPATGRPAARWWSRIRACQRAGGRTGGIELTQRAQHAAIRSTIARLSLHEQAHGSLTGRRTCSWGVSFPSRASSRVQTALFGVTSAGRSRRGPAVPRAALQIGRGLARNSAGGRCVIGPHGRHDVFGPLDASRRARVAR